MVGFCKQWCFSLPRADKKLGKTTLKLLDFASCKVTESINIQYFLPQTYKVNENNTHFDDTNFTGQYQKEVYLLAREILRSMTRLGSGKGKKLTAIDVGCGSGWKLVNYLSGEFRTVGIETEPVLSFLRKKFPDQVSFNDH